MSVSAVFKLIRCTNLRLISHSLVITTQYVGFVMHYFVQVHSIGKESQLSLFQYSNFYLSLLYY